MNRTIVFAGVVVLAALAFIIGYVSLQAPTPTDMPEPPVVAPPVPDPAPALQQYKVFVTPDGFRPESIRVPQGDLVSIQLMSIDEGMSVSVIATKEHFVLTPNKPESIQFQVTKDTSLFCSGGCINDSSMLIKAVS